MKKELWRAAKDNLYKKYGENPSVEVLNRYLSEYAEFRDTEAIVFFDLIRRLQEKARENQGLICVSGALGASFTAYLLGTGDINPLKPHYFCPNCKKIEFCSEVKCGWDLPDKVCSCGTRLEKDGHDLPHEMLRQAFANNLALDVSFSGNIQSVVRGEIADYFKGSKVVFMRYEHQNIEKAVIITDDAVDLPSNNSLIFEEYREKIKSYPQISLMHSDDLDRLACLINKSNAPYSDELLIGKPVLDAFIMGHTDGIPGFSSDYVKELIKKTKPKTFYELIQIAGLAHSSGTLDTVDNEFSFDKCIAFRDDVFNYVKEKLLEKGLQNTGYAYKVADDTRLGLYYKSGISQRGLHSFKELGLDDWFIDSLTKTKYLFPKAHAIAAFKNSLIFMRHKLDIK